MPSELKGIRVFVASPSGLEAERAVVSRELALFNHETGYSDGVCFIPVGWEQRPSGVGRPQAQINEDVSASDFFLLLLWDRWGSPTGEQQFSAGIEEEYTVAVRALTDSALPMRDIAVVFKGVEPRQLSDPGDQLARVLEFRRKLETEKSLLFSVFDSDEELRREIRKLLFRWMRVEFGESKGLSRSAPEPSETRDAATADGAQLQRAVRLARSGQAAEAEQQFSALLSESASPEALVEYAKFLRRSGRFAQARAASSRLLRIAQRSEQLPMMIRALSSLGVISRKEGRLDEAVRHFEQARLIIGELDLTDRDSAAAAGYALDNYGHTLRRRGELEDALEVLREALTIRRATGDEGGLGYSLNNLGIVQREKGLLEESRNSHEQALAIFKRLKWHNEEYITESDLGSVLEEQGDVEGADHMYLEALDRARANNNADSVSINLGKLARLRIKSGDLQAAGQYASECIEVNEQSGNEEGAAMGLLLLGQVLNAKRDSRPALEALELALERYSRIGHMNGRLQSLIDLAIVFARVGDLSRAKWAHDEAAAIVRTQPSPLLVTRLAEAQHELSLAGVATDDAVVTG